mmetsp:Transcript_86874/g.106555  ORF Transcript_86874/g.106555 Transcript_86874/m.106555 type:complete len:200 (+) Transcript_86874:33-632(+)
MSNKMKETSKFRIIVLGPGAVGKSCLTLRYVTGNFNSDYDPTIEENFDKHIMCEGQSVVASVTDTAGQQEFMAIHDEYYQDGNGFIFVYAIDSRASFIECQKFFDRLKRVRDDDDDTKPFSMLLVGNKCDLKESREVTFNEGKNLADDLGCKFYETSAKTGDGVRQAFEEVVREMKKAPSPKPIKPNNNGGLCKDCIIL